MEKFFSCVYAAFVLSFCTTQINASEIYGNPNDPLVAEVLGTQIRTNSAEEMQSVINQHLFQAYAKQHDIQASQEEIDLYIAKIDQFMLEDREKDAAKIIEIEQQLEAISLSEEQRKQLKSNLDDLQRLQTQARMDEMMNGQQRQEVLEARQTFARAIIERWAINKALYKQYGGRILSQQLGPEPLDAMHEYLQGQKQKQNFIIYDQAMEAFFWAYFTDDTRHDFYPSGSQEERQAFDQAPWLDNRDD
jgi:hypothetical protein